MFHIIPHHSEFFFGSLESLWTFFSKSQSSKDAKFRSVTLHKTNSSPLKNGVWKTIFFGVSPVFMCHVSFRDGITSSSNWQRTFCFTHPTNHRSIQKSGKKTTQRCFHHLLQLLPLVRVFYQMNISPFFVLHLDKRGIRRTFWDQTPFQVTWGSFIWFVDNKESLKRYHPNKNIRSEAISSKQKYQKSMSKVGPSLTVPKMVIPIQSSLVHVPSFQSETWNDIHVCCFLMSTLAQKMSKLPASA